MDEQRGKAVRKQLGMVDLTTGELMDGLPVWFGVKSRSPYGRRWDGMNQNFLEEVAAREDVHRKTYRVFTYLNAKLDFDNVISAPQRDTITALNMKRPNVSRAVKKLEELDVIIRGEKVGKVSACV